MAVSRPSPFTMLLPLNGTPVRLGVIQATTTKNNHDTTTAFNNEGDALKGKVLLLQTDAAVHIRFGTVNTVTASSTVTAAEYGVELAADERVIVTMGESYGWIAAVGNANVTVFELV